MKNLRKMLAVIAAGAAIVSMSACGSGGNSSSASNTLTISWWGNQQRNDRTTKINDMFAKENNVKIDGQFSEFGDYFKRLSTSAAGGTMPDVIQMDYNYLNQFIENDLLYDMSSLVDNNTIDLSDVDPSIVAAGQQGGTTYAVVAATTAPTLIYNKTLTDSLGITIPNDWTVEQFEDISRQIHERSGYKANFRYYDTAALMEYMLRADGIVLHESDKLGVSSASQLEPFFDVYETGIKEGWHLAPEVFADLSVSSVEQDPLVYGSSPDRKSWCTFKYPSQLGAYQSAAGADVNLALATWPSANVAKSNYVKPSQYWAISKNCKNPELAAKWINFYVNDVDANKIMLTDRGLPISAKVLDAVKDDFDDSDKSAMTYLQDVVMPASTTINPPWPAASSEISSTVLPRIEEDLCYGKITASEAAQQFFDQANEVLGK